MSAIPLTPPVAEPLTLDEAKAFLRVEHDDDDDVIAALIAAARRHVEITARCALASDVPDDLRQAIRLLLAHWYDHRAATDAVPARVSALIAPYRMLSL